MIVSFVIVTHNRRTTLGRTLDHLRGQQARFDFDSDLWIVDNGSNDGTAEYLAAEYPEASIIARSENEGTAARNYAIAAAPGKYLVLLDDDSYPLDDAVERSVRYLESHPGSAAVVGRVILPDGRLEACALPAVMLSGAVCIRKRALEITGGFRPEFFRKAGEYDLSFRIWQAGFRIDRFEDIIYRHDKVSTGRNQSFAHRMDLRNNLILVERFLPPTMRRIYRRDWLKRYAAPAIQEGHQEAVNLALVEAREWAERERRSGRQTLDPGVLETIFTWEKQEKCVADWATEQQVRRVVIADYGKNLYATFRACRLADLSINTIADNHPTYHLLLYHGIPILGDESALRPEPDGIVVSTVNPAQIDARIDELKQSFDGPILRLWEPKFMNPDHRLEDANDPILTGASSGRFLAV